MCPCAYCRGMIAGAMPGCRCEMCDRANERASINRNLGALAMIGGDVRGYTRPTMGHYGYGQRSGGCGCNGSR